MSSYGVGEVAKQFGIGQTSALLCAWEGNRIRIHTEIRIRISDHCRFMLDALA